MENRPVSPQPTGNAATELKVLQKQVADLKNELIDFRSELNNKLLKNPSDLVAFGVLKAGLALCVIVFVLSAILQLLFTGA